MSFWFIMKVHVLQFMLSKLNDIITVAEKLTFISFNSEFFSNTKLYQKSTCIPVYTFFDVDLHFPVMLKGRFC